MMKAITFSNYGAADVLKVSDVTKPAPKDNEILIRIHETVVTPSDVASRLGNPFIVRFFTGLFRPKLILGTDVAGVVEAVGKNVTQFKRGDRVFGSVEHGAYAEYVCVAEDGVITTLPEGMTFAETAGMCDAAMTALTFLRDIAKVHKGQHVLVNGASGSVGSFGVQLAKFFGAEVTGVCSGKNVAMVKSLGAEHVIDYTVADFAEPGRDYDIIFDAVSKSTFAHCKPALKPGGLYLTTVPTLNSIIQTLWTSRFGDKRAVFAATGLNQTREKLDFLKTLLEAGKLKSVIDRRYAPEQIVQAHQYVETGRKTGNVILVFAS